MSELFAIVRGTLRAHGGIMTQQDAIKDFLNNDLPHSIEDAAQEMGKAGYVDVARSMQETRWGVDKLSIEITDDESQPRGVLEEGVND